MATIKMLKHVNSEFATTVEGKTNSEIIKEVKAAGLTLGAKSLAAMLSGEKESAGEFKIETVKKSKKDAAEAQAALQQADEKLEANPNSSEAVAQHAAEVAALAGQPVIAAPAGVKTLTPEQAALAAEAEKQHGSEAKKSYRGTDWSKVLPQSPTAVLRDSKMHQLFVRLCDPAGATKEQLMTEFGWSAGGLGGIIHWEPKKHGYLLASEKKDGKLHYHLAFIGQGGRRVKADEVLVKDRKVVEPKQPKAPKAQAAPKTPKVRVPKEELQNVPPMAGVQVTKRVAAGAKKQA